MAEIPTAELSGMAADPRVVSVLLGVIVGSLLIPVVRDHFKVRTSRRNLVRMMYEDAINRANILDMSIKSIAEIITATKADKCFVPVIINTKGEDFLDLQKEKWMIPPELTQPVLKFYNLTKGLDDFAGFIDGDKFSNLEGERRIRVLEGMESRMKNASTAGQVLISLIEADWPVVRKK